MRTLRRITSILGAAAVTFSALSAGSFAAASGEPATKPAARLPTTVSSLPHDLDAEADDLTVSQPPPICGTGFGTPTGNGIPSWYGQSGAWDTAGAVDFLCSSAYMIDRVDVMGYYGNPSGSALFDVTFYANDTTNEPLNTALGTVCATQSALGAPTGSSSLTQTTIMLSPCAVQAGVTYWVEVQEHDASNPSNPWYWATQSTPTGSYDADWRDTTNLFSTPCSPGYGDSQYMQDCHGLANEPDFMFELDGVLTPPPPPPTQCATVDQLTWQFAASTGPRSMGRSEAADDFTCTGSPGPPEVSTLQWKGRYSSCGGPCNPAPSFQFRIYTDNPSGTTNEPGSYVCGGSFQYDSTSGVPPPGTYHQTGGTGPGLRTFDATLSSPCQLANGVTYWIAIKAKLGQSLVWKWEAAVGNAIDTRADWRQRNDPLCPNWNNGVYMEDCALGGQANRPNLIFRIN